MKRFCIGLVALVAIASSANAWNAKGHMVISMLAWRQLKPEERTKIVRLLEKHPHFDSYLKADKPDNISQDQWVFMRASTWADWVRSGPEERRKYHIGQAHYIDFPFVAPGSTVKGEPPAKINAVEHIRVSKLQMIAGGSREDQAVALTWLFHLVGDIHQPLHAVSYYSEQFPRGDKGGNLVLIRMNGRRVQLHSMWDGLFGNPTTLSSIMASVLEVEKLSENNEELKKDLAAHKTAVDWAKESFELAKKVTYLDGKLKMANRESDPATEDIPEAPADYGKKAGATARYCAAKAGPRLVEVLREILAKN